MKQQPCILMIEDNGNDETLVKIALERQATKYELVIARDGLAAVESLAVCREIFSAQTSSFSLVLLDLKPPKLNGLEVLRRIRADVSLNSMPVVVWTSSCEPADLRTAYSLGCNSYVQKPVNFNLFCEAVTQITSYWIDVNRGLQGVV